MGAFLRLCNSESAVSGAKTVPGDYITLLKLICKWSNFINKKMSRKTRNNKNRCNNYKKNYISNKNNMIVASLNDIQYKIDVLTEEIKKKENETIKTVIETFNAQKPEPESFETEMMKILMPELIKNPNAADALLRLSEKFK